VKLRKDNSTDVDKDRSPVMIPSIDLRRLAAARRDSMHQAAPTCSARGTSLQLWLHPSIPAGKRRSSRSEHNPVRGGLTMFLGTMTLGLMLVAQGPATAPAAEGPATGAWTRLFNGRDLTGWYTFMQVHGKNNDPDRIITIEDGMIRLYRHAAAGSRVVMGYIATEQEYGDYHLRWKYRWGEKKFAPRLNLKRNAGLFYHLIGDDRVWPRIMQFQIEQTNVGDLGAAPGFEVDT
jgi:hypothetical protein